MVDRDTSTVPTIYIADRGYEAYNNLAHIQERKQYFLIRVKDLKSTGIVSGLSLPATEEFDKSFSLYLTRKQTNAVKQNPNFKFVPNNVNFDYLPSRETLNKSAKNLCVSDNVRIYHKSLTDI